MSSYESISAEDLRRALEVELKKPDSALWQVVEKSIETRALESQSTKEVFDPKNPNPKLIDDARIQILSGSRTIDRELLRYTIEESLRLQAETDWDPYNRQHFGIIHEGEEIVRLPEVYPVYKPYRSHAEAYEFEFGGLQGYEYEPKDRKLTYFSVGTYLMDTFEKENDRVVLEIKGKIPTLVDAKKYVLTAQQNHVHFIFVFQTKNIVCPWMSAREPRADGTRMTQEEWCDRNGFDYCYVGELDQYKQSEHYKWLVENVGKDMVSLKDQIESGDKPEGASKKLMYSAYRRRKGK